MDFSYYSLETDNERIHRPVSFYIGLLAVLLAIAHIICVVILVIVDWDDTHGCLGLREWQVVSAFLAMCTITAILLFHQSSIIPAFAVALVSSLVLCYWGWAIRWEMHTNAANADLSDCKKTTLFAEFEYTLVMVTVLLISTCIIAFRFHDRLF